MPMETPPETLLGMPKEYAFLLVGLIIGSLIGWWIGRAWGLASASARSMAAHAALPMEAEGAVPPGINLVVNGRNIELPGEAMAEIQAHLHAGRTIDAIKALRDSSGLGLAEAKAVLESLEKVIR